MIKSFGIGETPLHLAKKSQFFSVKEILDSARPPLSEFFWKKNSFFYASPKCHLKNRQINQVHSAGVVQGQVPELH